MPRMHAVQVSRPDGLFEIVEREIPQATPREVRVIVQACGLCHSTRSRRTDTSPASRTRKESSKPPSSPPAQGGTAKCQADFQEECVSSRELAGAWVERRQWHSLGKAHLSSGAAGMSPRRKRLLKWFAARVERWFPW